MLPPNLGDILKLGYPERVGFCCLCGETCSKPLDFRGCPSLVSWGHLPHRLIRTSEKGKKTIRKTYHIMLKVHFSEKPSNSPGFMRNEHGTHIFPWISQYGGFLKWGYPQSSSFLRGCSLLNHPFRVTPIDGTPPYPPIFLCIFHDFPLQIPGDSPQGPWSLRRSGGRLHLHGDSDARCFKGPRPGGLEWSGDMGVS